MEHRMLVPGHFLMRNILLCQNENIIHKASNNKRGLLRMIWICKICSNIMIKNSTAKMVVSKYFPLISHCYPVCADAQHVIWKRLHSGSSRKQLNGLEIQVTISAPLWSMKITDQTAHRRKLNSASLKARPKPFFTWWLIGWALPALWLVECKRWCLERAFFVLRICLCFYRQNDIHMVCHYIGHMCKTRQVLTAYWQQLLG